MTNDWQPIGTASRASSNDEILATDYDIRETDEDLYLAVLAWYAQLVADRLNGVQR